MQIPAMTIVSPRSHPSMAPSWNKSLTRAFSDGVPSFKRRAHCTGADFVEFGQAPKRFFSESPTVTETPLQPNMAERAIDTATDVSRTINDVSVALQAAVDRLTEAIRTARQPGMPLSTLSAITREAPLASLFVAFLFGVAVARRR
jgi:hypothetical protein